jgi:RNA 3'-terminal phosphate cyclase-like protein
MELQGAKIFRFRIIASLISGRPVKISKIRSSSEYPGLTDAEVNYLQLVSQLTAGTVVDISESGTQVNFVPGVIINNPGHVGITFECHQSRSIGFYLEGILPFVIFGKNKLKLTMKGASHSPNDVGVDSIIYSHIPLLKSFGVEDINIKATGRGLDCEVILSLSPIRKVQKISITEPGKVKKVRGLAFTSRMNVQMGNRAAYAAKGLLHSFLPDIWIHTDHTKHGEASLGITLVAETNTGCYLTSEFLSSEASHLEHLESDVPEDLANLAVLHLLDEVWYGGCLDTPSQPLALILMALGGEESKIRFGRVSITSVEVLRMIFDVFNVKFRFSDVDNPVYQRNDDDDDEGEIPEDLPKSTILSCLGIDYENMARVAF